MPRLLRGSARVSAGWRRRSSGFRERLGATGVALGALVALLIPPLSGLAGGTATGPAGAASPGLPTVGALYTLNPDGSLASHFCTGSVVHSHKGDLVLTAAHCLAGRSPAEVAFVPRSAGAMTPFGVWQVTRVYTDAAWRERASADDDFAFLAVERAGSSLPIESVTGAEQISFGRPAGQLVRVVGYPDGASAPISCANRTRLFSATQLEFDCNGYTDGTSGSPFILGGSSGPGSVVGVIGGFEQGGLTPTVSYAARLQSAAQRLYEQAEAGG